MSKILIDEAVVRQALEALDELTDTEQTYGALDRGDKAITALRQALANAALDKKADNARALGLSYEQPAQQEPVSQRAHEMALRQWDHWKQYALELQEKLVKYEGGAPMVLNTSPPAPAEPDPDELTIAYLNGIDTGKKRKPWVGLTDEERRHLRKCNQQHDAYALAVEALLKEKNT
jgi:hypothetical protein